MAPSILLVSLACCLCMAVTGQDNERKNIKMLFVPAEVMKELHKNLATKDLTQGLPGQGTLQWTPVRLPGDRSHTFEIRINPHTAHKLNMNFQHFKIGRGHGLLLELKNVTLSTKGRTVLDSLVEFYKNCGGERNHRLGMRVIHHSLPMIHRHNPHSLLLPGDIPLLKRIQNALERFFPRRHDGSVDVFQHKDSSGAVHFLPFEEVRRQVNNLIKRTLVKRDCVKISTNALTRALSQFRKNYDNNTTTTPSLNEEDDYSDETDSVDKPARNDSQGEETEQLLSFSRNLNPRPVNKVNLTSSSATNVPSDAAATKIITALADLRKELKDLSSGLIKNMSQSISNNSKETDSMSTSNIGINTEDKTIGSNGNMGKNISSDSNETPDEKSNSNFEKSDKSEVKNERKKMSSDDGGDQNKTINRINNTNDDNNYGTNDMTNNSKSIINSSNIDERVIAVALKLKNIEDDLKADMQKTMLNPSKTISKISGDSKSAIKEINARPVNQTANQLQRLKTATEYSITTNVSAHFKVSDEQKNEKKQTKIRKDNAKYIGKHKNRRGNKKQVSLSFHYKPKSLRLKLRNKGRDYLKTEDNEQEENMHKHKGKGRFVHFINSRRPKIKEFMVPDERESDEYRQRNFHDSPVEAVNNDEDNMKVGLLRKLRWLRIHGHAPKVRSRKSPKLRVVVYDDEDEEKEPHQERWHNNEINEYEEKPHEDDTETESEAGSEFESEHVSDSSHRSASLLKDEENTKPYNQGEASHSRSESGSDMQYLSDSIGDDSTHLERSDSGVDVPDLEPYLKKHYADEEDEENEEIQMYNEQDGIDARKLGDSMEKHISKTPKEDNGILVEETNKIDENNDEVSGKVHIHKIPFKIQEDSEGVDTSPFKEPQHDALGLQRVLRPGPDFTSMASQPLPFASNPSMTTLNQNALDMSPNMVLPPEQSMMIPAELPEANGATTPVERPSPAALTGLSFQPSVTTQFNSMMPQTPFPQVSSIMPMQSAASEESQVAPVTPIMQPGQIRTVISRVKNRNESELHSRHASKTSGVGKKHIKFRRKDAVNVDAGNMKALRQK